MSKDQNSEAQVHDLIMSVRILTRSTLMFQNAVASKMSLNVTDAECIDFLMEMGSSTAGDLARVTGLTTGAMTSVIDRLEKAGYVKREKNPDDRRKVMVVFIPEKHKKIKKHYDSLSDNVFKLFSGYSKKELRFLLSCTRELNSIYLKQTEAANFQ